MEFIPENHVLEFLPDTLVAIRKIYDMGNGRMDQSVDILDEWIKKQSHFVNKNFNRHYLEHTIIQCKGSVEKAKKQIDKLCTYRTMYTSFFICNDLKEKLSHLNEKVHLVPLPKMTEDYQRIFLVKFNHEYLDASNYTELYRVTIAMAEYLKVHDYMNGFIVIDDLREVNLKQVLATINLFELQQFVTILMEGFGAKTKGIHLITPSKVVDVLVKVVSPFLTPKLAKRINVHSDLEGLHQVINKDLLPVELGGNDRTLNELRDKWMEVLITEDFEKHLEKSKTFCTDESLRQRNKVNEHCMELPGSFRTLTVD